MLDFLGIGAQKAGTTWLFKMLSMHPEVYFPLGKECHYWDTPPAKQHALHHYYLRAFMQTNIPDANKWKCGEITPAYALLPEETIRDLYATFPKARIFYVVRDPVERTWSAVKHLLFLEGLRINDVAMEKILQLARDNMPHNYYAEHLRRWREFYSVHVIDYGLLVKDPVDVLNALCRHIGISDGFFGKLPGDIVRQKVFSSAGSLPPEEFVRFVREECGSRDVIG